MKNLARLIAFVFSLWWLRYLSIDPHAEKEIHIIDDLVRHASFVDTALFTQIHPVVLFAIMNCQKGEVSKQTFAYRINSYQIRIR